MTKAPTNFTSNGRAASIVPTVSIVLARRSPRRWIKRGMP